MTEPNVNDWTYVEDQLSEKLLQLTLLLQHFANSENNDLNESAKNVNSDIEYILKDATFQIQNFKDFVHQNAQKELDMKILENSRVKLKAMRKKCDKELESKEMKMQQTVRFIYGTFIIFQNHSNTVIQNLNRQNIFLKNLQTHTSKEYENIINTSKLIIKEHEDSCKNAIQMFKNEKKKICLNVKEVFSEFQVSMLCIMTNYKEKFIFLQKRVNVELLMIASCVKEMHTSFCRELNHIKYHQKNYLLKSKWLNQVKFFKDLTLCVNNVASKTNFINIKLRDMLLAYMMSFLSIENQLYCSKKKAFDTVKTLNRMRQLHELNKISVNDEKTKILKLQNDLQMAYANTQELRVNNATLQNKLASMQNEIQTNREQYQKMISDFKFKFKVKQSQTAQIKMEKINLMSQSTNYLCNCIEATFKSQGEVNNRKLILIKDILSAQFQTHTTKWTNQFVALEKIVEIYTCKSNNLMRDLRNKFTEVQREFLNRVQGHALKTDSTTSICYSKILKIEDKIEKITAFGKCIEASTKSILLLYPNYSNKTKEVCRAFVYMLKNIESNMSHNLKFIRYSNVMNETNMQKIFNNLCNMKNSITNQRTENHKIMILSHSRLLKRLDELNDVLIKQGVPYHKALKVNNKNDEDKLNHALVFMKKEMDTKIDKVTKQVLLHEYKILNHYIKGIFLCHSYYKPLILDMKTALVTTSKDVFKFTQNVKMLNEVTTNNFNKQAASSNRCKSIFNKKLQKLSITHEQTLMEYSRKHNIAIGTCAKEWEKWVQTNLSYMYHKQSVHIENMKWKYENYIESLKNTLNNYETIISEKEKKIQDMMDLPIIVEGFEIQNNVIKNAHNILVISLLEAQRLLSKNRKLNLLEKMSTNHLQNITCYKDEFLQYQKESTRKQKDAEDQLNLLKIKHESRESRAEDLASILNLKQISIAKDIKIKRLLDENKIMKLELCNREENYNKIFGNKFTLLKNEN
ncbi:uncharacterized protein [Physcomitrium patens]|uniref:uncharacterized protein isoform X3 n=1 Tax=Physcomitrium patens TaxID=3218 RepID=UPI003CCCBF7E